MKKALFFLFLSLLFQMLLLGQKYRVQVNPPVDSMILLLPDRDSLFYSLHQEQSLYEFTIKEPERINIRLACSNCNKSHVLWIYSDEDGYWAKVEQKELQKNKSIATYVKENRQYFYQNMSIGEKVIFWSKIAISDRIPSLRSGSLKNTEPKLVFQMPLQNVSKWHYITPSDFEIPFEYKMDYPIDCIFIYDIETKRVIFHAGSEELFENIPGVIQGKSPSVNEIYESSQQVEEIIAGVINWQSVRPYLYEVMQPGKTYQIGLHLKDDPCLLNPYLFNFYFLTLTEIEKL